MASKLKPCPFCGGKPEFLKLTDAGASIIHCFCGVILHGTAMGWKKESEIKPMIEKDTIKKWNTRYGK